MSRRRFSGLVLARRATQVVFLLLFFGLLLAARSMPGEEPCAWWSAFFLTDPLVLMATWLAAHARPVALYAVPVLGLLVVVLGFIAAVRRRWVSPPVVLLAGLGALTAGMVGAQWADWSKIPAALLWALATLGLTAVLGRVFCGWVCPLGTIHAIASRMLTRKPRQSPGRDGWSRWQLAKYYILVGVLAMAVLGGHWGTIFDPLVLLYRTTTTALLPMTQWAVEEGSTTVYQDEPDLGKARPTLVTEPAYKFLRDHVFNVSKQVFLGTGLILGLFVVTVALNYYQRRFWCRYLCPLGALLGIVSLRPLMRRAVRQEGCNQCDLCGRTCHGAAAQAPGQGWIAAECFGCFHCHDSCPRNVLKFEIDLPWTKAQGEQPIDLSRRATLAAAVGGVAALALMRSTSEGRGQRFNPNLVRPPGAREEIEFLKRCTACGMCMKVCPTGGLQPAWTEAGLEGLWTPHLAPRIGYCSYQCNLCGQVCPTGAIQPLDMETKQQTKIGLASFDTTRCLPYAYGRSCIVCEEMCPVPHKAIYTVKVEVQDRDGQKTIIDQPRVDVDKCIGCGQCESVCVYKDRPAIRVFSTNETRHPDNQTVQPGAY